MAGAPATPAAASSALARHNAADCCTARWSGGAPGRRPSARACGPHHLGSTRGGRHGRRRHGLPRELSMQGYVCALSLCRSEHPGPAEVVGWRHADDFNTQAWPSILLHAAEGTPLALHPRARRRRCDDGWSAARGTALLCARRGSQVCTLLKLTTIGRSPPDGARTDAHVTLAACTSCALLIASSKGLIGARSPLSPPPNCPAVRAGRRPPPLVPPFLRLAGRPARARCPVC